MPPKKCSRRIKKTFSKKVEIKSSDDDGEEEEEDILPKKKQKSYLKRTPKKIKQKPKTKIAFKPKPKSSDDDDEEEEEESNSTLKTKPPKKLHLSNSSDDEKPSNQNSHLDSSEEEEEEDILPKKKQKSYLKRAPKKIKQKPKTKITFKPKPKSSEEEEEEEEEEESNSTLKTKPPKKLHLSNSSDDEKTSNQNSHLDSSEEEEEEESIPKSKASLKKETKPPKPQSDSEPDLDPVEDLNVDAPPEFLCPITMELMKDPVIMPDGQTYEREAIEQALKVKPISPMTREPMSIDQAKANCALKNSIDKYIQDHMPEIKNDPAAIDPENMFQDTKNDSGIPINEITEIQLETFSAVYNSDSMLITAKTEDVSGRLPLSIIAVIDISGSMRSEATLGSDLEENQHLTRLQLVQYSLKTIIATLDSSDQITLIPFNDHAFVKESSVKLDLAGKNKISKIIDNLSPYGRTNLWDGINKGIDEAVEQQSNKRNTSILVFTDGQPNIHPPNGLIPTLKEKLNDINVLFSISSFGYGYSIDANLLKNIAEIGNGIYGYCPNEYMVGTIFINCISNLISEISPLNVLTVNDKKFNVILYNGTATHVVIPLNENDEPEKFQINLNSILTNQTFLIKEIKKLDENDENSLNIFKDQKYRQALIDILSKANDSSLIDELRENILQLFEQLKNEKNRTQFMKYLMLDLFNDDKQHGDIERAFREENYNKRGKNYLVSMLRFQILEQCGNFRDMSLQLYSNNETFLKFRKFGNKVFMSLPIPQKSQIKRQPMRPKRAMRGRRPLKRYKADSDSYSNSNSESDNDSDSDSDDSNRKKHSVQCTKRSMTMRKVHKRKKSEYE